MNFAAIKDALFINIEIHKGRKIHEICMPEEKKLLITPCRDNKRQHKTK